MFSVYVRFFIVFVGFSGLFSTGCASQQQQLHEAKVEQETPRLIIHGNARRDPDQGWTPLIAGLPRPCETLDAWRQSILYSGYVPEVGQESILKADADVAMNALQRDPSCKDVLDRMQYFYSPSFFSLVLVARLSMDRKGLIPYTEFEKEWKRRHAQAVSLPALPAPPAQEKKAEPEVNSSGIMR